MGNITKVPIPPKSFFSPQGVVFLAVILAGAATAYSFVHGYIISYGDAESHLNIAKRIIESLTPGFAQLGGIWLPLPHILLMPFVYFDFLWRTGLAGSIISGIAFVVSSLYIYKFVFLLTKQEEASFLAALVFMTNPNILYLQSTPMTELVLIAFFLLSSYYFVRYLFSRGDILMLILAAFFGLCASLSRYDGWALVLMEAGVLFLYHLPFKMNVRHGNLSNLSPRNSDYELLEGRLILFGTLAFFGIALWLLWAFLIFGDPLYFMHSQFSANSQQLGWLTRGELPAYHNIWVSFAYYFVDALESAGIFVFLSGVFGGCSLFVYEKGRYSGYILLLLFVPFFFNVLTLFLGQSVIFLPDLTPATFEWNLFNVRYGAMMIPVFAFCTGYLFFRSKSLGKSFVAGFVALQGLFFLTGLSPVLAFEDGVSGLSSATAKMPDAQYWLNDHYDGGFLLVDDYARMISIIRTSIPMENVIYVGNKPYWEESFREPEKYARWIVIQKNDEVWRNVYEKPEINRRLFKYFNKVYTSNEILIFKRME